jgi:hypothetical protein
MLPKPEVKHDPELSSPRKNKSDKNDDLKDDVQHDIDL